MIYNRIQSIQKEGNWIESPYRLTTWMNMGSIIETITERIAELEKLKKFKNANQRNKSDLEERVMELKYLIELFGRLE